jgi:IMP dehydrogenase
MKLDNLAEGLTFDDVLLVPQYSDVMSRDQPLDWKLDKFIFSYPVIPANMDTISGFEMMKKMAQLGSLGSLGIHHRYCSIEDYTDLLVGWQHLIQDQDIPSGSLLAVSVGSMYNQMERARIDFCLHNRSSINIICIDIAHGDSLHMQQTLSYIRDKGFTGPIIAGNVCTPEATRFLLEHGATIVKVGFPQLSAIANCAEAGPIIADGGIRSSGDVAKALAAGAKAVMTGGMLAGTDCVPGWYETMVDYYVRLEYARKGISGSSFPEMPRITYRGMASKEARKGFGQEGTNAEGISRSTKCKPTEAVIMEIAEGVRSAMSYSGAHTLEEFPSKAKFIRVTNATQVENHPHFKE